MAYLGVTHSVPLQLLPLRSTTRFFLLFSLISQWLQTWPVLRNQDFWRFIFLGNWINSKTLACLHFVTGFITPRSRSHKPSYNVIDFVMCTRVVLFKNPGLSKDKQTTAEHGQICAEWPLKLSGLGVGFWWRIQTPLNLSHAKPLLPLTLTRQGFILFASRMIRQC